MSSHKITIFYDNYCSRCTRFIRWVRHWDSFHLVKIRQLRNPEHTRLFPGIDIQKGLKEMPSFSSGTWHYGYGTLYLIFKRCPVFWIAWPLFGLLKITKLGYFLYRQLALRRKIIPIHCDANVCRLQHR